MSALTYTERFVNLELKIKTQTPRLCLALDGVNKKDLFDIWIPKLNRKNLVIKLGLGALPDYSRSDIEDLTKKFDIFVDAKLHDIPSQVQAAVAKWRDVGVSYLTVHLSGGAKMLDLAQKETQNSDIKILGVSVLTSLNPQDLRQSWGYDGPISERVSELVKMGSDQGLTGFVSSAEELTDLKKKFPEKEIFWVNPGIHWPGETPSSDQKRSVDFKSALNRGSKMLVMGRTLMGAPDPVERIDQVLDWIKNNHAK